MVDPEGWRSAVPVEGNPLPPRGKEKRGPRIHRKAYARLSPLSMEEKRKGPAARRCADHPWKTRRDFEQRDALELNLLRMDDE
jgi:hypothetical protein